MIYTKKSAVYRVPSRSFLMPDRMQEKHFLVKEFHSTKVNFTTHLARKSKCAQIALCEHCQILQMIIFYITVINVLINSWYHLDSEKIASRLRRNEHVTSTFRVAKISSLRMFFQSAQDFLFLYCSSYSKGLWSAFHVSVKAKKSSRTWAMAVSTWTTSRKACFS